MKENYRNKRKAQLYENSKGKSNYMNWSIKFQGTRIPENLCTFVRANIRYQRQIIDRKGEDLGCGNLVEGRVL